MGNVVWAVRYTDGPSSVARTAYQSGMGDVGSGLGPKGRVVGSWGRQLPMGFSGSDSHNYSCPDGGSISMNWTQRQQPARLPSDTPPGHSPKQSRDICHDTKIN